MNINIPFGKPNISEKEIEGMIKVMESGILVHGQKTKEFEDEFAKRIGTNNGYMVS